MMTNTIWPLRVLRRAAFAALGVAFLSAPALADTPQIASPGGAASGSSFWTEPSGAQTFAKSSQANSALALGELTVDGVVEDVHRRWRRGLFIYPRFYRRGWHGHRFRSAHGPYRYRYHGWWYRRPWWIATRYDRRYPRRAYYNSRYEVRRGGRCDYWARQCSRNWGRRNADFYGCLRYHRCR